MKTYNTSALENQLSAASPGYLDDEQYIPLFNSKRDELLKFGVCSKGSASAKAVMLLTHVGILRAANDSPKGNPQPAVPNKVIDSFKTMPSADIVSTPTSKLTPGSTTNAEPKKGKATMDAESREILLYISQDFVMWATKGGLLAYHIESGDQLNKESFITYCAKHYGDVLFVDGKGEEERVSSGSVWWAWNEPDRRVVKSIIMEPTNKSQHDVDQTSFNRWYVLKKTMCEPDYNASKEDISPLLEHLMHISDGDEVAVMYFLNWLAQLYQFPETKIPVAILMYSKFGGLGKNLVQRLLKLVFGKPLVTGVTGKALQKTFDDAIEHKRIVFINELSRHERADGYENFKSQISEEEAQFEGKGRASKEVRNCAHFIITTNNLDAMPLMQGDRRIAVLMCNAAPRDEDYYRKLVEWIDGPGAPALANVLRTWEFPKNWNPYAPAPQTEAARIMQKESRSSLVVALEGLISEGMPPFDKDVGRYTQLACQLSTLYGNSLLRGCNLNNKTLPAALAAAGAVMINPDATTAKYKIWCWRNLDLHSKNGPSEWDKHLETGARVFKVPTETDESENQS